MIDVTDEEMEIIELFRKASDKDKEDVWKYLEEKLLEENWRGKVH